jgi:Trk K+ transport system NAD-binding subunit
MGTVKKRAKYYLLVIAVLILLSSILYDVGMRTFEPRAYPPAGVELSILHSMQVVVETFTATGYGSDSPWLSPEMNLLVVALDLTGVALFFLALPAILVPLFRRSLTPSVPTSVEETLTDHVVICTYTSRAEVLVEELRAHDVPYVLLEPDEDKAIELQNEDYTVVNADPESVEALERLNLANARALVADVSDRVDASIVLAAKEAEGTIRIISVVEDPDHEAYHRLAGADEVLTPRKLLGEGLGRKLTTGISSDVGEQLEIGEDFDIMEVPIRHGSELAGRTLASSELRERFGVNVIGAWFRGEFEAPPPPERTLDGGTILLVTGSANQLEALAAELRSTVRRFRRGETIVFGYGEVGKTIVSALEDAELRYSVVDHEPGDDVDIVGDATDREVLEAAGVDDARSVVLAIPDDTETEFATLAVRNLSESIEIIARAENVEAVRKTYRAGADYVLSLATVSGRSIASAVLEGENVLSIGTTVKVVRTGAPELVGKTLENANIRGLTGCTIVAIERGEQVLTDLDPDFEIQDGDELVIAGTDEGTELFAEYFT